MRRLILFLVAIAVVLPSIPLSAEDGRLVYALRFTDYEEGSVDDWLLGKGFQFRQDARKRDRLDFDIGPEGLVLETNRRAFAMLLNEAVNVPEFSSIEIDWGVTRFPKGASYEQGVRNEALMAVVFMGDERQSSGSMFVPDSPYFIGLFLCDGDDKLNHPYVGKYFKKGGRYVCTDKPEPGQQVTSRYNLLEAYRNFFDKERDDDPAISGLALTLDTQKAGDSGRATAFIREIRLYR